MSVYIVCVKKIGKHFFIFAKQRVLRVPHEMAFLASTHKMTSWHDSSASSYVLHMWPFRGFFYSQASCEIFAKLH